MMTSFLPEDRQALMRAAEVRQAAKALVEAVHDSIGTLFGSRADFRLSKVREDSDRVGLFFFLPSLGNAWCGVLLQGLDALQLKLELRAEAVTPLHDQLLRAGMTFEPPHYAGRLELVGLPGDSGVATALAALRRWLSLNGPHPA